MYFETYALKFALFGRCEWIVVFWIEIDKIKTKFILQNFI